MRLMLKTFLLLAGLLQFALLLSASGCRGLTWDDKEPKLFDAAANGDEKTANSLIAAGTYINAREAGGETPLMYAAANGQTKMVLFLLERGADINAVSDNGETALVRAGGDTATVKILLKKGADVELGGPLDRASYAGYLDTVKALLEKGANPNAELFDGNTALMAAAVQSGSKDIAEALIAAGADVKHKISRARPQKCLR